MTFPEKGEAPSTIEATNVGMARKGGKGFIRQFAANCHHMHEGLESPEGLDQVNPSALVPERRSSGEFVGHGQSSKLHLWRLHGLSGFSMQTAIIQPLLMPSGTTETLTCFTNNAQLLQELCTSFLIRFFTTC